MDLATIAISLWPFIALIIFANAAVVPAILTATVVPYLFLPEAFEIPLPGLPDLDKTAAISLGLVGGLVLFGYRARKKADFPTLRSAGRSFNFVLISLIVMLLIGLVLTVSTNSEVLIFGPTVLPAMRPWDAVGLLGELTLLLIPFFVAYRYFASPDTHLALLKVLVISGLFYSLLMLIEIRLSPQLHNWVYGYHQHSFLQHIRDGYRPKVFLQHGLWVGFFIFMTVIGAVALWKAERSGKWMFAAVWLFLVLMISENLGAFAIALMCLGVFGFLWHKMQIQIVIIIALTTLTYPALRQAELIPIEQILDTATNVSADRAASLGFRLRNEDLLLERAFEKPLAGWGGWSRDRIFNERGRDISVSEGRWIQTIGSRGWIGYISLFGLLTLPLLTLARTARRKEVPVQTIALALICAGNLIYMIPNSTLTPLGLLCFGALAGFAQFDLLENRKQSTGDQTQRLRTTHRYTRFPQAQKRHSLR